jgi:hypothetical protein
MRERELSLSKSDVLAWELARPPLLPKRKRNRKHFNSSAQGNTIILVDSAHSYRIFYLNVCFV